MNIFTRTEAGQGPMDWAKEDNIKAKTKSINHTLIMNWIRLIFSVFMGMSIILIGLYLFLKEPTNKNYIYLMLVGVFLFSTIKPNIDFINKLSGG